MELRLRRLVRTASSEQYALFDLDQADDDEGAQSTIGKLDLHYTAEGLYGTLLLWDDAAGRLSDEQREDFVYTLLDELSLPMGVPNEYVVEFFAPTLERYTVFHNVGLDDIDVDSGEADGDASQVDGASVEGMRHAGNIAGDGNEIARERVETSGRNAASASESAGEAEGQMSRPAGEQGDTSTGSSSSVKASQDELGEPLPEFDVKPED